MTTIKSNKFFIQDTLTAYKYFTGSGSGYDPSQREDDGNTALCCAAIEGNMAVVV